MKNITRFKYAAVISVAGFLIMTSTTAVANRDARQAELDAACEKAREAKLAPMREQFIEECVKNEEQPDRESCELFYSDFGVQSGNRAPLFFDLPECVEAFEFQNNRD